MYQQVVCPVCAAEVGGVKELACHLVGQAEASDGRHIMWLNRRVTKHRATPAELEPALRAVLAGDEPPSARVRR